MAEEHYEGLDEELEDETPRIWNPLKRWMLKRELVNLSSKFHIPENIVKGVYGPFEDPGLWLQYLESQGYSDSIFLIEDLFRDYNSFLRKVTSKLRKEAERMNKDYDRVHRITAQTESPVRETPTGSEIKSNRATLYPALGIGIGMIALGIALRPDRTTPTLEERTELPGLVQSDSTADTSAIARGYPNNVIELILAQTDRLNTLKDSITVLNRRLTQAGEGTGRYTEDQYQRVSRLSERLGRDVARLAAERDSAYAQRDRVVRTSSENATTAARAAKTAALSAVVESLPRAAREFEYTRMETPTQIGFYSFRRPTPLDKVEDIVAEAEQLAGCRAELRVYGVTPAQVDSYTTGNLIIRVAKNPFDGGILGVEITRR